jgi:class 3 adenylate cyclase
VLALEVNKAPLRVRLGIAAGLVVVGHLIGEGEARERGVVGETPNLAARLQTLAEPGAVVIASSTRADRRSVRVSRSWRRGSGVASALGAVEERT